MSDKIVVVGLKPLKVLDEYTPAVDGKVLHLTDAESVRKLTPEQALALHNQYVEKDDKLPKGTPADKVYAELFTLLSDNLGAVGVDVPQAPDTRKSAAAVVLLDPISVPPAPAKRRGRGPGRPRMEGATGAQTIAQTIARALQTANDAFAKEIEKAVKDKTNEIIGRTRKV